MSAKTWRCVTRFTSQSSYFHGEHHWPNSTDVEKNDLQPPPPPPPFHDAISSSKVEIQISLRWKYLLFPLKKCHLFVQFLGAGIDDETTYRRTGKEFYDLLFVDHFGLRL